MGKIGNLQTVQPSGLQSHELHDVSDGATTPSYQSNWPQSAMSPQSCGVAMELLTKCTQEQSERVSSTSRSVCLIRPHFILLLLLQFIAKPSETYIYLYCTVTVWRLWGAPLFYKVDAWSLFTPGSANFSQQNEEENIHFFLNKSCCWFFLKETFQCKPCKQNPFYLHNTEGKMNPSLKIKMRMT